MNQRRVADLPGFIAEVSGAEVRAFVPSSTEAIPPQIDDLQLRGARAGLRTKV